MVQLSLLTACEKHSLIDTHHLLETYFDAPAPRTTLDPVSQMILSILGGRTMGHVALSAFVTLRATYNSDWDAVRDAPELDIFSLIREVTFPDVKARRIQMVLTLITQKCGDFDLGFLADMSVDDALLWLETLPGIGRQISASVLNLSTLHKKAIIIDTHYLRLLKRLGFIDNKADTYTAYEYAMANLPGYWSAQDFEYHHHYMKRLGQTMCFSSIPVCRDCPIGNHCQQNLASPPSKHKTIGAITSRRTDIIYPRNARTRLGKALSRTSSSDNKSFDVATPACTTLSRVPVINGCQSGNPSPAANRR